MVDSGRFDLDQHFGPDRDEPTAQKGPQGRGVPGCHLRPQQFAVRDQSERLDDQDSARASRGLLWFEQFDRHFAASDEPGTDRDQPVLIRVHAYAAPMMASATNPRVMFEIMSFVERSASDRGTTDRATGSAADKHGVVRTDGAVRAGQPAEQIGMRRSPIAVGAARRHLIGIPCRQHEGMSGELDDRDDPRIVRFAHLDGTVARWKSTVRRCDQRCVERMHGLEITVGPCASM